MLREGIRVARLERVLRSSQSPGPPVLIVWSDDWPDADRAAFDTADVAGDRGARREPVMRHTERRVGPGTAVIEIRTRADGPKWGYEVGRTPSMIALLCAAERGGGELEAFISPLRPCRISRRCDANTRDQLDQLDPPGPTGGAKTDRRLGRRCKSPA